MGSGQGALSRVILFLLLFAALVAGPARAVELWSGEEGERTVSLDTSLKWTGLASHASDDLAGGSSNSALFRLRLGLDAALRDSVRVEVDYEQRARVVSGGTGLGAGGAILPSFGGAPYRLTQLDWQLAADGDSFEYRHEVDRAFVALSPDWGEVTIGRQAIGLGRGMVFGAVDVFSPFSTVEVDRDWRRGIDAFRLEYRVSDTTSVEVLAAFGETWDDSAVLGRARGYFGNIDGELIIGKRGEDAMYGGTLSAVIGDAEAHLELAIFNTPEAQPDGGLFGDDHLVGKAVLGSSYTFDVGRGLTVIGEYHYSGFGVKDVSDATIRFLNPDFQKRFWRGDMQILGRHALAAQLAYPVNDALMLSFLLLGSPADGSGLAAPALSWSVSERASLSVSGFLAWGAGSDRLGLGSEYGSSPMSLFAQWNLYF